MSITRRRFLKTGSAGLAGATTLGSTSLVLNQAYAEEAAAGHFSYGVASGDPTRTAVIIWTQFTPLTGSSVPVAWEVATDQQMLNPVVSGVFVTTAARNFTVKVDVTGLQPGQTYYYRFAAMGQVSPLGRTRTAPEGSTDSARFAVVSCSSYPHGYFNVYRALAQRDDLDAILHLGDYIYEYEQDVYSEPSLSSERAVAPATELITLDDYRRRHALYKLDSDLQAVHQAHPFISVWDDHEFTNNAWTGGAENHNEGEGDWYERMAVARQAYFEWMPVREQAGGRIYRQFVWGDLIDLLLLDTRVEGRDEQPSGADSLREAQDENRTLLGFEQEDWLYNKLQASSAQWKILGQQVMVAQRYLIDIDRYLQDDVAASFWLDSWDGYAANRERLLAVLRENDLKNTVILTGDIHSSMASEITGDPYSRRDYDRNTGEGALAVEFIAPSVTSPGFPAAIADEAAAIIKARGPHIKYAELTSHGFILLSVDREKVQSDWYYVPSVLSPSADTYFGAGYYCVDGEAHLIEADGPAV